MTAYHPDTRVETIDGMQLQYLFYPGGEPTVVLLHATGFLPWLWHPIARQLAGSHRVIAPYFCDYRRPDPAHGGLAWTLLAQDLAILCDRLAVEAPVLAGHSMGATVATLAQALHGLDATGMVLIEPIFFPPEEYRTPRRLEDNRLASRALRRRNRWDDPDAVAAYLRTKALFADWTAEMLDLYVAHGTVDHPHGGRQLTCPPPREAAIFMGATARDPWPLIPDIACPVLVVEGGASDLRRRIDFPAIATRFPRGRHRRVADAGHLVPMEKPGEVLNILRDFIRRPHGSAHRRPEPDTD